MNDIAPKSRPAGPIRRAPPAPSLPIFPLVAGAVRGLLGVVCLAAAVLYLPIHFSTPVLSGVSVLMCVSGSHTCWKVGRSDPRIQPVAKFLVWGIPIAVVLVFIAMMTLGAGYFGPDWYGLSGR